MQRIVGDVQRFQRVSIYQERRTEAATVRFLLRLVGSGLQGGAVPANRRNLCAPVTERSRPGPKPMFTERVVVMIRPDQRQALDRICRTLELSVSDIARWMIDQGVAAIEDADTYHTLREMKARL